MYKIYWKHVNGVCGNGEGVFKYSLAKAWVDKGNKEFPDIVHILKKI